MSERPITHHEAPPDWIGLSRSIGAIDELHQTFLSSFRRMQGKLLPGMISEARFDFSSASWDYTIYLGSGRVVLNDGKMKVFSVDGEADGIDVGLLSEEVEGALSDVSDTIRTLLRSRKIRLHGRRTKLQSPFENVPLDLFESADFVVDVLGNAAVFPDGDRYLSLHVELLTNALRVEAPGGASPHKVGRVTKRSVEQLVSAMAAEHPKLITKTRAAEILNMTQRARPFFPAWRAACEEFNKLGLKTERPYGAPGRPKKSAAPNNRRRN